MTATAARAAINTPTDRTIHIERTFDASRDRVWNAFTDPTLVAQWWGRGHTLEIERDEVVKGGHWRYVEHEGDERHSFKGRYREVTPKDRIVRTFEWDGMPAYVVIEDTTFTDLGNGRTKVVTTSLFHTAEARDGFMASGMEGGLNESYVALDALLARTK